MTGTATHKPLTGRNGLAAWATGKGAATVALMATLAVPVAIAQDSPTGTDAGGDRTAATYQGGILEVISSGGPDFFPINPASVAEPEPEPEPEPQPEPAPEPDATPDLLEADREDAVEDDTGEDDTGEGDIGRAAEVRRRLDSVETAMRSVEARRDSIDHDRGATISELLRSLRASADAAAALADLTLRLDATETRIRDLLQREADLRALLWDNTRSIETLTRPVLAAARAPAPLSLTITADPLASARSAMIASRVIGDIEHDMAIVRTEIDDLARLAAMLEDERATLAEDSAQEAERLTYLEAAISEKQQVVDSLTGARDAATGQLLELSGLTEDLQTAVSVLEDEARRFRTSRQRRDALGLQAPPDRNEDRSEGRAPDGSFAANDRPNGLSPGEDGLYLPSAGQIVAAYGEVDRFGEPAPGMRIAADDEGRIVAPLRGTVRFSGEFGGYERLLILEHRGGYHSLIAGFERIVVAPGDIVEAGDLLGVAPRSHNSQLPQPLIYFEFRQDGRPVAPIEGLARAQERG